MERMFIGYILYNIERVYLIQLFWYIYINNKYFICNSFMTKYISCYITIINVSILNSESCSIMIGGGLFLILKLYKYWLD